jgi:hypothetical protein
MILPVMTMAGIDVGMGVGVLSSIASLSPIIAILIAVIIWLAWKNQRLEEKLDDLNVHIRDSERETLRVMSDMTHSLSSLAHTTDSIPGDIKVHIDNLRDYISLKIESMRN